MRIKLKYPDVDTFLKRYGPNLTEDSVFIATKSLKPVGTPLRFEFVLVSETGEQPVFRGEGTVSTVREEAAAAVGKPAGMLIQFSRLFGDGAELIQRAINARPRRVTRPPAPATEAAAPPAVEQPPPAADSFRSTRETTGEIELANPRDIPSGEFQALKPPAEDEGAAPGGVPLRDLPATLPPASHIDVDALAKEWQISTDRVDEILRRRRPRDPALAAELEGLLGTPPPASVSHAEATARLAQLLDRRRKPR